MEKPIAHNGFDVGSIPTKPMRLMGLEPIPFAWKANNVPFIQNRIFKERWLRGLKHWFAKPTYPYRYRGFKSLSFLCHLNLINP